MVKHLRIYTLFFQSLFLLPLAHAEQWDWVPRESLSAEQQSTLNSYCSGAYIDQWQPTNSDDTNLEADVIYQDTTGVVHLKGAAKVIRPDSTVEADAIEGIPDQYYKVEGDVTLRKKNQLIRSNSGYLSDTTSAPTEFTNAQFLEYNTGMRGEAKSLLKNNNGVIFIHEGFYTTCEPGANVSWALYGSSIELDPASGFGTAKHVQIRLSGIPIFYFPWLRFPIDNKRHTGFLFPSFGYNHNDGMSLSIPFYWNLAPNYDATITPHFVQHEGEGADIELRYLNQYGETTFEQSTFYDDLEGEQTLRKLESTQDLNDYFTAGLTLEDNPTEDKYPDVNTTSIGAKTHYQRSAYLSFTDGNYNSTLTEKRYQTPDLSNNQPFEWLPRLDNSYQYANSFLNYSAEVQYTNFYDPDENNFDGERTAINQDLSFDYSNAWGSLTPGVLAKYRDYTVHSYKNDTDTYTDVGQVSEYIDGNVVFEKRIFDGTSVSRQTLEPRFTYLNSPYVDQDDIPNFDASESAMNYSQAFSHERFSGNDRIGDTRQLALGVESRFYDANNKERWALKLGQLFYFKDRYVSTTGSTDESSAVDDSSESPLLTSATYTGDTYSITGNFNYDLNDNSSNLAQIVAKLQPTDRVKINLSYLYTIDNTDPDDDAKQTNVSTIFPLSQNWSVFLQHTYDFFGKETTKKVGGLGYENCCVKISLSYQRWLNDDSEIKRGIFLQFILRSLSTAGRQSSESSIADDFWNDGQVGY